MSTCRYLMKNPSKEQVETTANAIMSHFIPKDDGVVTFSFYFTIPPAFSFKADYEKSEKKRWVLKHVEAVEA